MATNAYMEPYSYYAEDQIVGIDVEIAQAKQTNWEWNWRSAIWNWIPFLMN